MSGEISSAKNLVTRFHAGDAVRQDEMTHKKSPFGEALRFDHEVADLPMHLAHRFPVDPNIIPHMRVYASQRLIAIFHVGHIDVVDAVASGLS